LKPKLVEDEGLLILSDKYQTVAASNAAPIGLSQVKSTSSSLGTTIVGNQVTFPQNIQEGVFQVTWTFFGTGAVAWVPPFITSTLNITYLKVFENNVVSNYTVPVSGVTTTTVLMTFYLHVNYSLPTTYFTFSASGTLPTTFIAGDLHINQVNDDAYLYLFKEKEKEKFKNERKNRPPKQNKDQMLHNLDDDLAEGKYQLTRRNLVTNLQDQAEWPDLAGLKIDDNEKKERKYHRQLYSKATVAGESTGRDDYESDDEEFILVRKPKDF
jgi:hypothetical protein